MRRNIYLGSIIFVLFFSLFGIVVNFIYHSNYLHRYGEILNLYELHPNVRIEKIYDHGDLGVEIYLGNINSISSKNMLDMYSFVCDLETKLNENKKILSSDEYVRPVRITASLKMNKDSHQTIISNVFFDNYNESEYKFDTYRCYFDADFNDIDYLCSVKNLLFYYPVNDITDADQFVNLKYLYIKVDDNSKERLVKLLPDCNIEFEEDNRQRIVLF